jgi:tRNA G46 methylase TrmB
VVLEIGFGMGGTTAHIAAVMPEKDFIGVEVHTPGVGSLLKLIGEQGLTNLKAIQHDAVEVLNHMIPDGSLHGVHIYFPDPWHKARHNKRRLIQAPFVKHWCRSWKWAATSTGDRLGRLRGADAGSAERGRGPAEYRRWLRAAAGLSSADQV